MASRGIQGQTCCIRYNRLDRISAQKATRPSSHTLLTWKFFAMSDDRILGQCPYSEGAVFPGRRRCFAAR